MNILWVEMVAVSLSAFTNTRGRHRTDTAALNNSC
uniref:Uncharacterized protein n=1 Tax=Anguilla anguilla TaxID=7936 RepID=A0A0E9TVA6_ANGAN